MKQSLLVWGAATLLGFSLLPAQDKNISPIDEATCEQCRTALVVGLADYKEVPLKNPVNDARDMQRTLQQLGFKVELVINKNRREILKAVNRFGEALKQGGTGLFYYSGHGMQVDGKNYLIPLQAEINAPGDVAIEAVNIGMVLEKMSVAFSRPNIVILDACRNNPYADKSWYRSLTKGLARISTPNETLLAYATAPGDVALDGSGENSPYTAALLKELPVPGQNIYDVFVGTAGKVKQSTAGRQRPWFATDVTESFYFAGPAPDDSSADSITRNDTSPPEARSRRIAEFRSTPLSNLESETEMVKRWDFYEKKENRTGKGFANDYEAKIIQRQNVIVDHASGLMWQQSGSEGYRTYAAATEYIITLNQERFAGFNDWRLPTVEEAMSLMEPRKNSNKLYIESLFDAKIRWIWTSDQNSASRVWGVDFELGNCYDNVTYYYNTISVRAVRSIEQTGESP